MHLLSLLFRAGLRLALRTAGLLLLLLTDDFVLASTQLEHRLIRRLLSDQRRWQRRGGRLIVSRRQLLDRLLHRFEHGGQMRLRFLVVQLFAESFRFFQQR